MNFWLLTLIGLQLIGLIINLAKHGEPRTGEKYDFTSSLISFLLVTFLVIMAMRQGFQ